MANFATTNPKVNFRFDRKTKLILAGFLFVPIVLGVIYIAFTTVQSLTSRASSIPDGVGVQTVTNNSARVQWNIETAKAAKVKYGKSVSALDKETFSAGTETNDGVDITGLEPNTTYFYEIIIDDQTYGPYSFTTSTDVSPILSINPISRFSPTPETSVDPSPSIPIATPTDSNTIPTPTVTGAVDCNGNDCAAISDNTGLNGACTIEQYWQCLTRNGDEPPTAAPTSALTATPTPTGSSSSSSDSCELSFIQANACTSWTWDSISNKVQSCRDTYTQYFVQCKSSSFTASDPSTWYCNERVGSNQLTVPCGNAPTPGAGQAVFCRVRAETESGGDSNATAWIYGNTTCSKTDTGSACKIAYLQANNCNSWIWDLVNSKLPQCNDSFKHYFFQCKDAAFTTPHPSVSASPTPTGTNFEKWYCNITLTDHFKDFPCDNAPQPLPGNAIYCRVRAEDEGAGDVGVSDWVYTHVASCPSNTPTPSASATPTRTPTPTNTPVP